MCVRVYGFVEKYRYCVEQPLEELVKKDTTRLLVPLFCWMIPIQEYIMFHEDTSKLLKPVTDYLGGPEDVCGKPTIVGFPQTSPGQR